MSQYYLLKNPSMPRHMTSYVFYYRKQVAYLSLPLQFLAVRRHNVPLASPQKAFKTAVGKAGTMI
jgi:hypothetical protein